MLGNKPIQQDDQYRAPDLRPTWPNKVRTDPYCPSVWAMPSNDTPFIIKSGEELPAKTRKPVGMMLRDKEGEKATRSHMKMPSTACQSFTTATAKDALSRLSEP